MPSINMIAPRREEKKRLEANVRKLLLVIVIEIAVVVSIFTLLVTKIIGTQSRIADLDRQLAKLQPTVDKIACFEKSTKQLKPKLDVLNQAKADTTVWCRVLQDVSRSLPDKIWLTRMATSASPNSSDVIVNLNGVSADQALVGQAMLKMHDTVADFRNIDLRFTQKTMLGQLSAVEFEMAAGVKLPEKSDKEVEKS